MGKDLEDEYINNRERCAFARHRFVDVFGSEESADKFIEIYLNEMKNPANTLFHNKFIARGYKKE